jgi:hypothetical protein
MEKGLTRNQIISVLAKSPHGALEEYVPVGLAAAREEPDFLGHLVAWNHARGQIRDSKVALPVLALSNRGLLPALRDNALAALGLLSPRELVRAVRFAKGRPEVPKRAVYRQAEASLRRWENPKAFDRVALQHRAVLKELYALMHVKPSELANDVLFAGSKRGVFGDVARLAEMTPAEAAGAIVTKRIPFLVAHGALGARAKDPAVVQALIEAMSPTELVTNSKLLERLGVKTDPALRAAYEAGLARVSASSKANTLKTLVAARAVGGQVGEKLAEAQERQIKRLGGVDGDWLVAADRSQSMQVAIAAARQVAAFLARSVSGKVHLVFFNQSPTYYDATGKTLEQIEAMTAGVTAAGATSVGCALQYAAERGLPVDGVALVSDGAENTAPSFAAAHAALCKRLDKDVPVYLYWVPCYQPSSQFGGNWPEAVRHAAALAGIDLQVFDLRGGVDYYALPNLVQTMRTNRYSLADEILETPLLTLGKRTKGESDAREAEAAEL